MQTLRIAGPAPAPALVVMLPGVYSQPQEFVDEGFVEALRRRGIAADVLVADAHLGYYNEKTVIERLRQDVVLPARRAGYRQLWLLGISIGGFGALGYAVRHGSEIDGVLALAPYLGRRTLLKAIGDAGGPRAWLAGAPAREADDADAELWAWLASPRAPTPSVYLGYGRDDRFADAQRVAAGLLDSGHGFDGPGGHDWGPWRALWERWLERGLLPRTAAA